MRMTGSDKKYRCSDKRTWRSVARTRCLQGRMRYLRLNSICFFIILVYDIFQYFLLKQNFMANGDWLSGTQKGKYDMATTWVAFVRANFEMLKISALEMDVFEAAVNAVKENIFISASERTPAITLQLRNDLAAMVTVMRDIKRRYFFVPPLTVHNLTTLGLKQKDPTQTEVPAPTTFPEGSLHFTGPAMMEIRKINPYITNLQGASAYGVRIYYGVVGAPYAADKFGLKERPSTGEELPHSVFTRRRTHMFTFTGMSGCEVFFCMRYENAKGIIGPWGYMMKAYIP